MSSSDDFQCESKEADDIDKYNRALQYLKAQLKSFYIDPSKIKRSHLRKLKQFQQFYEEIHFSALDFSFQVLFRFLKNSDG